MHSLAWHRFQRYRFIEKRKKYLREVWHMSEEEINNEMIKFTHRKDRTPCSCWACRGQKYKEELPVNARRQLELGNEVEIQD